MKIIYGTNVTENKKNTVGDENDFKIDRVSENQIKKFRFAYEKIGKQLSFSCVFIFLLLLRSILLLIWSIVFILSFYTLIKNDFSFNSLFPTRDAKTIEIVGLVCFFVWGILFILDQLKKRKMPLSKRINAMAELEKAADECAIEQDIPEDAANVDVMNYNYKIKNNRIKIMSPAISNFNKAAFIKDDFLCLADVSRIIYIPIKDITGIKRVNKRIKAIFWNKEESSQSEKYRNCKIIMRDDNSFIVTEYYSIIVVHNAETYELGIMPYDIDFFKEKLNLEIVE